MATLTPVDESVLSNTGDVYAVWIGFPENAVGAYNKETKTVTVPEGFKGQQYVVLSTSKTVTDDSTIAGPAVFEL